MKNEEFEEGPKVLGTICRDRAIGEKNLRKLVKRHKIQHRKWIHAPTLNGNSRR
jgi:hypothetical protein